MLLLTSLAAAAVTCEDIVYMVDIGLRPDAIAAALAGEELSEDVLLCVEESPAVPRETLEVLRGGPQPQQAEPTQPASAVGPPEATRPADQTADQGPPTSVCVWMVMQHNAEWREAWFDARLAEGRTHFVVMPDKGANNYVCAY